MAPHDPFAACAGPAAALAVPPPAPCRVVPVLTQGDDPLRVAQRLLRAGDPAGALAWLDLAPGLPVAHLGRAVCLSQLGRDEEADEALALALAGPMEDGILPLQLASACARAGHDALAMGLLEVAVRVEPSFAPRALDDPAFSALRDHPRFLVIVGAL